MSAKLRTPLNRLVALVGMALVIATGVHFVAHANRIGDASAQPAAAAAVDTVSISNFLYKPATVTVAVGTRLAFVNHDDAPHTATSGKSPSSDGVFDTGTLTKGQTKRVKLTKAGTFTYYCEIHPFMNGTVVVR